MLVRLKDERVQRVLPVLEGIETHRLQSVDGEERGGVNTLQRDVFPHVTRVHLALIAHGAAAVHAQDVLFLSQSSSDRPGAHEVHDLRVGEIGGRCVVDLGLLLVADVHEAKDSLGVLAQSVGYLSCLRGDEGLLVVRQWEDAVLEVHLWKKSGIQVSLQRSN